MGSISDLIGTISNPSGSISKTAATISYPNTGTITTSGSNAPDNRILLETGDSILLETGDYILLESA